MSRWQHPGGKLREQGASSLTDAELLAILVSTGIKGKSAEEISEEVLRKFGSLEGLANQPLERLLEVKGLSDVKIIRIAAAYELARRLAAARPDRSPRPVRS
jgi:DNA repair protein RadC